MKHWLNDHKCLRVNSIYLLLRILFVLGKKVCLVSVCSLSCESAVAVGLLKVVVAVGTVLGSAGL